MDNSQIRKIIGLYLEQLSYNIDPIAPEMGGAEMGVTPLGLIDITSPEEAEVAMTTVLTRDYCGNYIYEDASLERILTENGYIDRDGTYCAYIKDYQGNNRVTIDENGATHDITAYYPYGMPFTPFNGLDRYKYSGKEFDPTNGLNLYDSKARWYDSALALTTTLDPKAEKYYNISPYVWCAGNPIINIDPMGERIEFIPESSEKFKSYFWDTIKHFESIGINQIFSELITSSQTIYIAETSEENNFDPNSFTIEWNPLVGLRTNEAVELSPATLLNHEGDHALRFIKDPKGIKSDQKILDNSFGNKEERRVITGTEQKTAEALGEVEQDMPTRLDHFGVSYHVNNPLSNSDLNEIIVNPK